MADRDRIDRILALIDGTRTAREIADLTGACHRYVRNLAVRKGIRSGLRRERGGMKAEILALADGKRTAREIADQVGCDPSTVRAYLRSYGIVSKAERVGRKSTALGVKAGAGPSGDDGLFRLLNLSPEVAAWVAAQCGAGALPADVVRGVLVDAYYDEIEGAGAY